jgi:predicted RecB family nuclease
MSRQAWRRRHKGQTQVVDSRNPLGWARTVILSALATRTEIAIKAIPRTLIDFEYDPEIAWLYLLEILFGAAISAAARIAIELVRRSHRAAI